MVEEPKKEKAEVRSFRITEETMAKFNSIKDELKLNQDSALGLLIGAYEMEKAKEAIPDRETEIANFQLKAKELVEAFLYSLQLNQDAEARVRAEFERELNRNKLLLDEKIEEIARLNVQIALWQTRAGQADDLKEKLEDKERLVYQIKHDTADRMAEKDRIISNLDKQLAMVTIQADGYDSLKTERDTLSEQLQEAQITIKDLTKDHQMEMERAAMAAKQAQDEAVASVRSEAATEIAALKDQLQEVKIAGMKDLQTAEKAAHEADKASAAEIRRLEQENARLREQMAELGQKVREEK